MSCYDKTRKEDREDHYDHNERMDFELKTITQRKKDREEWQRR